LSHEAPVLMQREIDRNTESLRHDSRYRRISRLRAVLVALLAWCSEHPPSILGASSST
jgi:hypothetical protein